MSTQMSKPPKHPNVPFVDLGAQYRTIATEVNQAISKVIEQTDFILGREVHLFEEEFAAFCDALVPDRKHDLARLGFRAMIAGTLANFLSATLAGMLL